MTFRQIGDSCINGIHLQPHASTEYHTDATVDKVDCSQEAGSAVGARGMRISPSLSNFFHFHAVFCQKVFAPKSWAGVPILEIQDAPLH